MKTPKQPASPRRQRRLVRVPWSRDEDETILLFYAYANGAVVSFREQANHLNRKFHGGQPVRTISAVRRRETKLLSGNANANVDLPDTAAQDSTSKSNTPAVSG